MKMKMTMLAAALALTVAGQANAAIVAGTDGSSDVILTIWDSVNNTSYQKDLGINLSSFLSGVSGTNTALIANTSLTSVASQSFAADALLTSYLATANQSDLIWNVTAIDNTGALNFRQKQLITTTNVNIKSVANSLSTVSPNSNMNTAVGNLDLTLVSANGAVNANSGGVNTSVTAGPADAWIAKINQANTSLAFRTSSAIGSTMNFWYVTPSSTSAVGKASVAQFGSTAGVATWTLASNGNLSYAAPVAAVPEPGEWLLMLSGLALIGFVATRRKDEGSMTFA